LAGQDHYAYERCPSWYAVQQNDYHSNSTHSTATSQRQQLAKLKCIIASQQLINYST